MTEGTQPPPVSEIPQEIVEEPKELEEIDQATNEPAAHVEHTVDMKVSEDTQKEFESVVEAVQTFESSQAEAAAALDEARGSTGSEESIPAGETGGKSDFGAGTSPAAEHYSGVEMTQGEVAQDSDWNEGSKDPSDSRKADEAQAEDKNTAEKAAAGEGGSKSGGAVAQKGQDPERDTSKARTGEVDKDPTGETGGKSDFGAGTSPAAEHYSGVEMTQGEVAQDSDWNTEADQGDDQSSDEEDVSQDSEDSGDETTGPESGPDTPADGIIASDGQYTPTFNNNQQIVLDNIAGQTEAVQGATEGLKMANELVKQLANILAELQAEEPARDDYEKEEDYKKAVKEHQQKVEHAQERVDTAKKDQEAATKQTREETTSSSKKPDPDISEALDEYQSYISGPVSLDDIAETAKSQEDQDGETTGEGKGKKSGTSFNTPAGGNLINFSARSVGAVGLQVAGSVIPGGSVIANAIGGSTGSGEAPLSGSEGGTSNLAAEQNMEFITLQNNIQMQSRQYQTLSNALKARHDITQSSIQNIKGGEDTGTNPGDQSHSSPADDPPDAAQMAQESMLKAVQDDEQDLGDMAEKTKQYNEMKQQIRDQADALKDVLTDSGFQAEDAGNIVLTGFMAEYEDSDLIKPEQNITLTKEEAESLLEDLEASLDDSEQSTSTPELTEEQLDELESIQTKINEFGGAIDIDTLIQLVLFEVYESEEDFLNDVLEKMKNMNELKQKKRDFMMEMKKAKESLRKGYTEGTISDTQLSVEDIGSTTAIEFAYQIPEGTIIVDESLTNAEKSNLRDAISTLREEVLTLKDEVDDWPDYDNRTITYNEIIKLEDGSYAVREVTKTMTKDEAKALIASMENLITALENSLDEG